jgi:hypothetical protein
MSSRERRSQASGHRCGLINPASWDLLGALVRPGRNSPAL